MLNASVDSHVQIEVGHAIISPVLMVWLKGSDPNRVERDCIGALQVHRRYVHLSRSCVLVCGVRRESARALIKESTS